MNEQDKEFITSAFSVTERTITEYIADFYNTEPEDMFKNLGMDLSKSDQSIILAPIPGYTNSCIQLKLEIVPHDYKAQIPFELKYHTRVSDCIDFFCDAVDFIYGLIILDNIKDEMRSKVDELPFDFEIDENNLTFYPTHFYPERRREIMLKHGIEEAIKVKDDESVIAKMREELATIKYDSTVADRQEAEYNNKIAKYKRIGIVYKELPIADSERMQRMHDEFESIIVCNCGEKHPPRYHNNL